jgi:hypothetical protein
VQNLFRLAPENAYVPRANRQFLDLGAGLPSQGSTHEVARLVQPGARVVYVDSDHCNSGCAPGAPDVPAGDVAENHRHEGAVASRRPIRTFASIQSYLLAYGKREAGLDRTRLSAVWQDPEWAWLLMVAYFLLSLVTGISISVGVGPGPFSLSGWVATAFFAWRVAFGGRISRMLLIVLSWAGFIFAVVLVRTGFSVAEFGILVASVAQIALLLSPAVYVRTRPDHGGREPLWRTRQPRRVAVTLVVGAILSLTWTVVYATALSRHDKAGLFHGGEGATAAASAILFLISLAGLTLPFAPEVHR